jgi:hypothetical protein
MTGRYAFSVAQQDHWSECGRAASVANCQDLGRPHRSVLALGDVRVSIYEDPCQRDDTNRKHALFFRVEDRLADQGPGARCFHAGRRWFAGPPHARAAKPKAGSARKAALPAPDRFGRLAAKRLTHERAFGQIH